MALNLTNFLVQSSPGVARTPARSMTMSYDEEADVMYVSFGAPRESDETEHDPQGVIYRYAGKELVGATILHVSKRDASGKLPAA